MIEFKPVTKQDASKLRKYYKDCDYGLCEYSVGTKLMWRPTLHPAWAEAAGCLVVRNEHDGKWVFDYPVAGPEGDEDAALEAIEDYCLSHGVSPVISVVPECRAARLLARYPYVPSAISAPGGTMYITGRTCSCSPGGAIPDSATISKSSIPSGRMPISGR